MPERFDPVRDGDKSLAVKNPGLVAEWHPTLNGTLIVEAVSARSDKQVWWAPQVRRRGGPTFVLDPVPA